MSEKSFSKSTRSLYDNSFEGFISEPETSILGTLVDNYHGVALSTTIDAWKGEISILKETLSKFKNKDGRILFEYDISRLDKRIDVVLLYQGIILCLEFKVGEGRLLLSRAYPIFSLTTLTYALKGGSYIITELTKREKTTEIFFAEAGAFITVRTHNTDLKNRLSRYCKLYPEECRLLAKDREFGLLECCFELIH